jgi:hypothetical protein
VICFASLLTDYEKNDKESKALTACEVQYKPYELFNNSGKDDPLGGGVILLDGGIAKFGQQQLKTKHELMKASEVEELCTFSSTNKLFCSRRVDNAKMGAFVAAERRVRREFFNLVLKKWGGRGDGRGEYTARGKVTGRHFGRSFVDWELFGVVFEICKISHFFGRTLHSLRKRGRKFCLPTSCWNRNIQLEHFRRFRWRFGREGG